MELIHSAKLDAYQGMSIIANRRRRDRWSPSPPGTAGRVLRSRSKYGHAQIVEAKNAETISSWIINVSWNSEAGRVTGCIIKVHTKNVSYKRICLLREQGCDLI